MLRRTSWKHMDEIIYRKNISTKWQSRFVNFEIQLEDVKCTNSSVSRVCANSTYTCWWYTYLIICIGDLQNVVTKSDMNGSGVRARVALTVPEFRQMHLKLSPYAWTVIVWTSVEFSSRVLMLSVLWSGRDIRFVRYRSPRRVINNKWGMALSLPSIARLASEQMKQTKGGGYVRPSSSLYTDPTKLREHPSLVISATNLWVWL